MNENTATTILKFLSPKEILISIILLLVLTAGSLGIANQTGILGPNVQQLEQNIGTLNTALLEYSIQNEGSLPTFNNGLALPTVTTNTLFQSGIDVGLLDGIIGEYISGDESFNSSDYFVGVLSEGTLIIGTNQTGQEPYIQQVK